MKKGQLTLPESKTPFTFFPSSDPEATIALSMSPTCETTHENHWRRFILYTSNTGGQVADPILLYELGRLFANEETTRGKRKKCNKVYRFIAIQLTQQKARSINLQYYTEKLRRLSPANYVPEFLFHNLEVLTGSVSPRSPRWPF